MHHSQGAHGGDLKADTVTIIGATLDLQEKVVSQVIHLLLTDDLPLILS
jgi:metal transporter CNNM